MKSQTLLQSFVTYCQDHPEERFWQALRNWSKWSFIGVSNDLVSWRDTMFWEGRSSFIEGIGPDQKIKSHRIDVRHVCAICDKVYGEHEAYSNRCTYGPKSAMLNGVKFLDTVFAPKNGWEPPADDSNKMLVQDRLQSRRYQGDEQESSAERLS